MLKRIIPYFLYHNKKGMNGIHLHIHPLLEISKADSIFFLVLTVNFFLDFMAFFPYPCWKTINEKYNLFFNKKYSLFTINSAWKTTKIPHPIYLTRSLVKI